MTYDHKIIVKKLNVSGYVLGWVWFSFYVKVHNEKVEFSKVHFQKAECLVKTVKKCFLIKLSIWIALIKVAVWGINYQKGQCIYKGVYFILFFFFLGCEFVSYLNQLLYHT